MRDFTVIVVAFIVGYVCWPLAVAYVAYRAVRFVIDRIKGKHAVRRNRYVPRKQLLLRNAK